MLWLKRTGGFGGMENVGGLNEGCFTGTMVGTPDCSGLRNLWEAGSTSSSKLGHKGKDSDSSSWKGG